MRVLLVVAAASPVWEGPELPSNGRWLPVRVIVANGTGLASRDGWLRQAGPFQARQLEQRLPVLKRASYARDMPFKDTPGLRRVAAMAIENRDLVEVRVLPTPSLHVVEGTELREGQILSMPRRRALDLVARGVVELLD